VQRQLDAYNRHDMEGFLATYDRSARIYRFPGCELMMAGHDTIREGYLSRFSEGSAVRATILNRIVEGRFVIDAESITGLLPAGEVRATLIYDVSEGLIHRVWILRDPC